MKAKLGDLATDLFGECGGGDLEQTPEYFVLLFESGAFGLRHDEEKDEPSETGHRLYEEITRLAEQSEPEEYKVARQCAEIHAELMKRDYSPGYKFFMETVDDVTAMGDDNIMLDSPSHDLFPLIFARAVRSLGKRHHSYVLLKKIIKRYRAGVSFDVQREENEKRLSELNAKYKAEKEGNAR